MIDTENINKNFTVGGERGDFNPEVRLQNLENEIQELAAKCVAAMKKSSKQKPKNTFQ